MSSLFSLTPSVSDCGVITVVGLKFEQASVRKSSARSQPTSAKDCYVSAAYVVRLETEHLFASSLQTLYHHGTHPFQKLVAERVVFLAVFSENCGVEKDSCGRFDRARGELPCVKREHPRPPEQVA